MPPPSGKRNILDDHRRALRLLDGQDGDTEAIMLAHGFSDALLANLVEKGLVTAHRERVKRSRRIVEVMRLRITEEGRRALR